jgi:hypothetical protein
MTQAALGLLRMLLAVAAVDGVLHALKRSIGEAPERFVEKVDTRKT